jgi:DNA invertase Pin-like site-specific DNA recombinase
MDTSTAAGKCFLDMLGVFAEFETNLVYTAKRD